MRRLSELDKGIPRQGDVTSGTTRPLTPTEAIIQKMKADRDRLAATGLKKRSFGDKLKGVFDR